MQAYQQEVLLKEIVNYMTDYMRIVIENGIQFTKEHFFMMLKELQPEFIDAFTGRFLRILVEELSIGASDIEEFISQLVKSAATANNTSSTVLLYSSTDSLNNSNLGKNVIQQQQ